ncbi:MAG: peptidoglycan recognition protein family protein [Planctomycetes bacterium]|nr:peptidoglycan recognition protein family protein [Planctomycetota bacterium]
MNVRPRPGRLAFAVVAFYAIIYGFALTPRAAGGRSRAWKPPTLPWPFDRHPKPRPPADSGAPPLQPLPGVPFAAIPPLPESLVPIEGQLVRPETREWLYIVVHHSAGAHGNAAEFDKYHREEKGWEHGLGYHFVVGNGNGSPVGAVEVGGRWIEQLQGAHAGAKATKYNQHGIGICVVGNYQEVEFPEEVYPGLRDLVVWLAKRYSITPDRILPHGEVRGEPTECPGKNFPLERLREDVRQALK